MSYFNFTKVTPAAPNDPVVNEATQLNANWDHLDSRLQPYIVGGSPLSGIETGQESFDTNFRYVVYDGAAQRVPDDIDANWSAWTNIPMATGRFIRSGFQPKWRNNSKLRIVQCAGGVQFDSGAGAWPMGTSFLVSADSSGSPPLSMLPLGGRHISTCATALTAGTSVTAAAHVIVDDQPGGSGFCRIHCQYLGGGGGGNFIMLDQLWWWY